MSVAKHPVPADNKQLAATMGKSAVFGVIANCVQVAGSSLSPS